MFNKLTSLGKTKNETTGILENPMSGVLGFGEIPLGASSGQRELIQDLLALTALGLQFQRAKGQERRREERGCEKREGRKEGGRCGGKREEGAWRKGGRGRRKWGRSVQKGSGGVFWRAVALASDPPRCRYFGVHHISHKLQNMGFGAMLAARVLVGSFRGFPKPCGCLPCSLGCLTQQTHLGSFNSQKPGHSVGNCPLTSWEESH